jgi:hypothetical protein
MTDFKFVIGDALYDLYTPYDSGDDETWEYPVVKRTERYVYVYDCPWRDFARRLVRFSIADLERDGQAWNAANRMLLYTRPLPHWPHMPPIVRKPVPLALEA